MDKNILKELNRTREIMGLNLLSEEELKTNDTIKEDIEEMDMEEMHHAEEGYTKEAYMDEMEDEVVKEQEEEGEEGEEEEEEVKIDPNAIVTKYKDILFGQDGINIGAELVYKFNKQAKEPVKGSAVVRWSDYGDLISRSDERKPVKDWKYDWNKDRQLYTKLVDEYPSRYKIGISTMLKKMVARKAEELGVDIGDVNELFASFSAFDPSRYKPRHVEMKSDTVNRYDGEKGLYRGYELVRTKREGEQEAPEKFDSFVLTYTPKKGGEQKRVSFYKNGNLRSNRYSWEEMVQGITDRNELYEFCQVLPDELKKAPKWSTNTRVSGKYGTTNNIKC